MPLLASCARAALSGAWMAAVELFFEVVMDAVAIAMMNIIAILSSTAWLISAHVILRAKKGVRAHDHAYGLL